MRRPFTFFTRAAIMETVEFRSEQQKPTPVEYSVSYSR